MSRSTRKPIPYGRQTIDDSDVDAVRQALNRDFLTQGPAVGAFESEIESATTASHATAVSSATAGLHLAYKGLGLTENETVWTSRLRLSQQPTRRVLGNDLVDVDVSTGNMCPQKLEDKLKYSIGRRTPCACRTGPPRRSELRHGGDRGRATDELRYCTHHTRLGAVMRASQSVPANSRTLPYSVSIR